jgi:hypothetical protein
MMQPQKGKKGCIPSYLGNCHVTGWVASEVARRQILLEWTGLSLAAPWALWRKCLEENKTNAFGSYTGSMVTRKGTSFPNVWRFLAEMFPNVWFLQNCFQISDGFLQFSKSPQPQLRKITREQGWQFELGSGPWPSRQTASYCSGAAL